MQYDKRKMILGMIIGMAVALSLLSYSFYSAAQPVLSNSDKQISIVVKKGMGAKDIGELLYEQKLIRSVLIFRVMARLEGLESSLQAGEYSFMPNMTIPQIVAKISKGQTTYRYLTIPEGYTTEQIAQLIEERRFGSASKFKEVAKKYAPQDYMRGNSDTVYQSEGYLFPDTYQIPNGFTEEQLVKMMAAQFDSQLTSSVRKRASDMGLSITQLVILASLVEKEAQKEIDRPLIAGVFLNRLKQDIPLQSCATIQYILGYAKPELTIQDTEIKSPYNTYQHSGLPPGPIANPGAASIKAVLYPANTDYLYFVADKSGAHHFSKTYEEHLGAIELVTR